MNVVLKRQRQQQIREILARNEVRSQEQLLALLGAERIETTQATLSRDLRDLGAVRGAGGYALPDPAVRGRLENKELRQALKATRSMRRGGTVLVLRSDPGHAPALAVLIEQAALPQVLGTIAGHDTVFVAAGSAGEARELLRLFRT